MANWSKLTAALAVAGCVAGGASGAGAITLEQAIVETLQTNPEIEAIRSNRRAIDQELRAARGLYYPSIDINGSVGYEVTNPAGPAGEIDLTRSTIGATFNQLIFDGFGREGEIDRQKGRVRSAAWRVYDTIEAIGLRTVEAYLDVLRTTEVVSIAEQNVRRHNEMLDLVRRRADSGAGPRSDVDQALARLGAARASLAAAEGRREDAAANYIAVVGVPPENLEPIDIPSEALPETVDRAVESALATSPVVRVAESEIDRADGEITIAQSEFWPEFNLRAQATRNEDIGGVVGETYNYNVLGVMTYNIFRGGIDAARVQESKERRAQTVNELEVARRDVAEETRLAWNGLNASQEQREALATQVEANEKVRDAYFQQFEVNRRSLLDLLDVENELFVSRTSLVTEDYTVAFGVYRVLATMGVLTSTLGITAPAEAQSMVD